MSALNKYRGSCRCHAVQIELALPKSIDTYVPRACDCDFCTSRKIAYISDPSGLLRVRSKKALLAAKQGSNQAAFLVCPDCSDVVVASYSDGGTAIASLNVNLLEKRAELSQPQAVSPKALSGEEKVDRWKQIWMPLNIESTD